MNPIDKLPPYSLDAEQGVLGGILLSPNENLSECIARFKSSEVFYDLKHRHVYEALVGLFDAQSQIDLLTVKAALEKSGFPKEGIFSFLSGLTDKAGMAGHIEAYVEILEEKYTLRRLLKTCGNVVQRIGEHKGDVNLLLDEVEIDVLAIRSGQVGESKSAKHLVSESLDKLQALFEKQGSISGLSTGLRDLDKLSDGMHPGEMIVLAAFPSTGKTAMAINIAVHNALQKIPVGVFSCEMKPVQLMTRSICSESRVNLFDIRDGKATEGDFQKMTRSSASLSNAPIYMENASGWTIGQLMASARRMKQQHGIKLIVVDYIQLLTAPADSREQEVSKISKGLKSIAMELDIPIIALSQLNDEGKLRESRAIGQDAYSIWKLEIEGEKQPAVQPIKMEIQKNREGATGFLNLTFIKTITRFENASKIED